MGWNEGLVILTGTRGTRKVRYFPDVSYDSSIDICT